MSKSIMELANEIFAMNGDLKDMLERGEKLQKEKIKKEVDFEGYLQDIYIESEHPLDDMIPDGFADWIDGADIQDIIDYAQKYAEKIYKERIK